MSLLAIRPEHSAHLFRAVLESAEAGILVLDPLGHPLYLNAAARELLDTAAAATAALAPHLAPVLDRLRQGAPQVIDRWALGELLLRVRARRLDPAGLVTLELTAHSAGAGARAVEQLARGLRLPMPEARLLALLWRGLSNQEIGERLGVRLGTIKSRLFRLYQKLGVKRRPAAVLRAAEILAS